MNIILSEKTVDGIATAIFISYADKLFPVRIEEKGVIQPAFSDNFISFMPSREKAARVKKALVKYGGLSIIPEIKLCLLSCETDCLTTAFNYACKFLDCKKDVSDNFADPVVLKFHDTVRKVNNERHRILGFLRFSENENGILYAPFSPDNDVAEIVAPHFLARLSGIPFVIHDVKRNKAVISDGKNLKTVETNKDAALFLSQNEKEFLSLWKKYFNSVNIKERKNLRLQSHFMPKKYRKFAPETFEDNKK